MSPTPNPRRVFRLPWRSARTVEADVEEELRFHLEMRAAELMARRGLDPAAARAEALRQFGDVEDARRYIREVDLETERNLRRHDHMASIRQDLKHTLRALRRAPGFAAVVVLALAVGIGSATAIFSLVNALLLRPLPIPQPERLVGFGDPAQVRSVSTGPVRTDLFSYPLYTELRDRSRLVPSLAAVGTLGRVDVTVEGEGSAEPEQPRARLVSGNYFEVLGLRAALGRPLTPADDRVAGASAVAVLSHAYWEERFGRDPAVLGRTLRVNGAAVVVVGVGPAGFQGDMVESRTDFWIPLTMQPLLMPNQGRLEDRATSWLLLLGRPRPGATREQAGAELTALARQAIAAGGVPPGDRALEGTVQAFPAGRGLSSLREEMDGVLMMLMTLSGLVLLVVAANVANLLLARATARQTEIGVRLALGAGRGRVVRHLLAESVLLGVAAGALALAVVRMGGSLIARQALSGGRPLNLDVTPDARVFAFAAGLSLATAVVLGILPALRATRVELAPTLRAHSRGLSGGPFGGAGRRLGLGKWLVVGQVAVSLVLLSSAGLLVRSVRNLEGSEVGVARDELLMIDVDANVAGYRGERFHVLQATLAERLRRLPGVREATYSQLGIFSGSEMASTLQVPGFVARTEEDTTANFDQVGPGYLRAVGARIVRGRDILPSDDARAPRVAVVNESMARFFFADRDPIGQYLHLDTLRYQVVGVVTDVAAQSLRAAPSRRFYTPYAQGEGGGSFVMVLRVPGDPAAVATAARREILAADPSLRVVRSEPLAALMSRTIEGERMAARLGATAGVLALALAALGLYGVMTYTTARRTGEFGLRMALGAHPGEVTGMVLRETMRLFLLGTALGIPAAVGAARLIRGQLFGVGLVDVPTLAGALLVLAVSAALAGYRPASRAARVSPRVALGHE